MTRFKHYSSGRLYGIQYWFEQPGDEIPEHAHDSTLAHNILVLSGEVMLVMADGQRRHIESGQILDFDWSKRHRIVAKSSAIIVNFMLNGIPEGYDRLPSSELEGTLGVRP